MSSLVHSPGFTDDSVLELRSNSAVHRGLAPFFRLLPPERVGLNGEYDHSGLAKRVNRALHEVFSQQPLETLRITQRGRVVVLAGRVSNVGLLQQFIVIASGISGANAVETLGVTVAE